MIHRSKKWPLLIILSFSLLYLFGCWSNKDLIQMAFVTGVGLDKTEDNKFELTLQIVKPAVVGAKEGGKPTESPVWIYSTKGDTVFEAVRSQLTTVNRKPFYSHVQLIIIGEKLAKEGIGDVLDVFERDYEPVLSSGILIAKGTTAKEILTAKSELEDIPVSHIRDIMKNIQANPVIEEVDLINLFKQLSTPGQSATIGVVEIVKKASPLNIKDLQVHGSAVFKKDRLIGWLKPIETMGYLYTQNKVKSGIINIPNPLDKNKFISIQRTAADGKIDVQLSQDHHLKWLVSIDAQGTLGEQQGLGNLTTQQMLHVLEKEAGAAIQQQIQQVIHLAQKQYKSDIFGFGEKLYKKYPHIWNDLSDDWHDYFSDIVVEIQVDFKIKNTGLVTKPLQAK
ncbi:Ger(x)C family spore germination protein [Clostridiaceae bacterium 35-E11]